MVLQSVFVAVRDDFPMVAALHPVNGFLVLFVTIAIARLAWLGRQAAIAAAATKASATPLAPAEVPS